MEIPVHTGKTASLYWIRPRVVDLMTSEVMVWQSIKWLAPSKVNVLVL